MSSQLYYGRNIWIKSSKISHHNDKDKNNNSYKPYHFNKNAWRRIHTCITVASAKK
jgi:hypothetical protein